MLNTPWFLAELFTISAPVQAITVNSDNATAMSPRSTKTLTFVEHQPGTLRCVSLGGYPPPDMQLFLSDNTNITHLFSLTYTSSLSGVKGLKKILYRTERWTHAFTAAGKYDGQQVRCLVTVPGLESNVSVINLQIQCKYHLALILLLAVYFSTSITFHWSHRKDDLIHWLFRPPIFCHPCTHPRQPSADTCLGNNPLPTQHAFCIEARCSGLRA